MKLRFFIASLAMLSALSASAQFTIPTLEPAKKVGAVPLVDTLKGRPIDNSYFSRARAQAERKARFKERNTIEYNVTLTASQTQFINWQAGGDNSFSGRSTMLFHHLYKREKFSLDYRFDARYGVNYIDESTFKNEDEFRLNVISAWTMHKNWSYAATANLRSQFTPGRKSRTDRRRISSFMAPGFIDVSGGFNYKKGAWNITLSPLSGSVTTVLNDSLRIKGVDGKGVSGVPIGDRTKGQIGPSVRIFFDKQFGKNNTFRYRSSLYSFTNIKTPPTVRWENTIDIRATKLLTTTLYGAYYFDKFSGTQRPQYNYSLSIGLSYWIKNK